jgi:hypothetical protein
MEAHRQQSSPGYPNRCNLGLIRGDEGERLCKRNHPKPLDRETFSTSLCEKDRTTNIGHFLWQKQRQQHRIVSYRTNLSALKKEIPTVAGLFAACFMLPIIFTTKETKDTCWHADKEVFKVLTTRLQNEDAFGTIRSETLSQNASGETSSGNDIIVRFTRHFCFDGYIKFNLRRQVMQEIH